jgi:transposase
MASVLQIASPDAIRGIQRVQTVTIAWMSVEAVVSLLAAWRARSPALLAFGGDSAIELFSAMVVLWRFRTTAHGGNGKADCPCRGSLVVRAGCLRRDPLSGCVFVFRSRSGTAIRLLTYDGQGYWLLQKRLSKNRFHWWPEGDQPAKRLESYEAQLLLAAGDVSRIRAAPMWRRVDESN